MHGIKSKGIPATVLWPKVPGFMATSIKLWMGMAMDIKQDMTTIALAYLQNNLAIAIAIYTHQSKPVASLLQLAGWNSDATGFDQCVYKFCNLLK